MPHRPSLYRVCGPALVFGGILLLAAFSLRPPPPATIQEALELGLDKWVLANWMFAVGAVLILGGWRGLSEHLNDATVEGWSTLGMGGVAVGATGLALAGAINAEGLPVLLESFQSVDAASAENSYLTVSAIVHALAFISWTLLWIGLALTGLAIAEDDEYPHWLGYSGLLIAVLEIATQMLPQQSVLHDAFGILGCVWLVVVGVIFTRIAPGSMGFTKWPKEKPLVDREVPANQL